MSQAPTENLCWFLFIVGGSVKPDRVRRGFDDRHDLKVDPVRRPLNGIFLRTIGRDQGRDTTVVFPNANFMAAVGNRIVG